MKPRPRKPAPRTLSATPPTMTRAPASSLYQARFPSLMAVVAGGVLIPACEAPACGDTRVDELEAHGRRGVDQLRGGRGSEAIREIGVAVGLVRHDATSTPRVQSAGEAAPVTTLPRPQVVPTPPPPGGIAPVNPDPPEPDRIAPQGGPMPVRPTPPTPRPPTPTPPTHPRNEPRAIPGGLGAVSPAPHASPRGRG